jgi:glycosyltransferase involved in cell wall biosynthesis
MNILHLEASSGWGGQEIRILREAEGMRARGHTVVLGVVKGGKLVERGREAGFQVYELNFMRTGWIKCLFELLSIIKKEKIELVNTHSSLDSWIGGIAARVARKAIVRTRHLSTEIKKGWNSRILYGKLADFVVTTCASIVPMICKQARRPLEECKSIATGVNPEKIRFEEEEAVRFRKELGLHPGDFLVGTACFMRSWKGIDDFLKAADLLRDVSGLKWVIIGGGHEGVYRKRAQEIGLDGIVFFTGHLENPFPAIGSLDAFALLSTANEGVSQAILQAAYLERPLIATPTGGLCEVCIPGVTGLRVDPFSPDQVARSVVQLMEDRELGKELGQNGKKRVMEQFTLKSTLDQMEEVYNIVLKRK